MKNISFGDFVTFLGKLIASIWLIIAAVDIWQADGTLLPYHKDFVLKLLKSFYTNNNFISSDQWITDVTVIGSLTTNKYLRVSDFDCHVIVDINKFIECSQYLSCT